MLRKALSDGSLARLMDHLLLDVYHRTIGDERHRTQLYNNGCASLNNGYDSLNTGYAKILINNF